MLAAVCHAFALLQGETLGCSFPRGVMREVLDYALGSHWLKEAEEEARRDQEI